MIPNAFAAVGNERTITVQNVPGSSVPGCEKFDGCFIPNRPSIRPGDTVVWTNPDTTAHTTTSGSAADGPDGVFDSSLMMAGQTFSYQFTKSGLYNYYCMVHPWMEGIIIVKEGPDWTPPSSSPSVPASKIYSNIILDPLPTTFKAKGSDSRADVTFSGELESADKKFFLSGATITLKFTGFTVDEKKYYEITTDNKGKFNKVITLPLGKNCRVQAVFDGGESTSGNIWTSSKSQTEYFDVRPGAFQPQTTAPTEDSSPAGGVALLVIIMIVVIVAIAIKKRKKKIPVTIPPPSGRGTAGTATITKASKPRKTPRAGRAPLLMGKIRQAKRAVGRQSPKSKSKMVTMHYLRCKVCLNEELENEADGQQYCTKCKWRKI